MPVTRINNNQISDSSAGNLYLGIDASTKLQDYSVTSGKIANNLTYGSDLTVAGNLTVTGNTTTIDTVNVVVEDPLILLADAQTGSPTLDIGFIGKRGTETNIAMVWDESSDSFAAVYTTSEVTNTTINISSYASFEAGNLTTGGTLDVTGETTLTGNVTVNNFFVDGQKTIDMGNSIIGNVQNPVANNDVATKQYVDSQSASGFTIEDDTANTTVVSGGDTLELLGTANEVTVAITAADQITFGLPTDVVVAGNLDAANLNATTNVTGTTFTASGNVNANNAVITNGVESTTVTATGNIDGANVNATTNVTGTTFTASGNVNANNSITTNLVQGTTVTATGNVNGGNVVATNNVDAVTITATGNLNGNNAVVTNDVSTATLTASGNVLAQNVNSNAAVTGVSGSFSGNVDANNAIVTNLVQGTTVTATGNVNGGNVVATNNVDAVTITATGNLNGNNAVVTNDVSTATLTASGNVLAQNVNSNAAVTGITGSFSGNVDANNAIITNLVQGTTVTATGNVNGGNVVATNNVDAVTITASGNVNGNNAVITNDVSTTTVTASGNIAGANVNATTNVTGTTFTASGNVNANNVIATNEVFGATLVASGNIDGANLNLSLTAYAGNVEATGNVDAGIAVNTNAIHGNPLALYSQGDLSLIATGNILGNGTVINNVADPVQPQDVATKYYVDSVAEGLHIHASVEAATPANLATITGGTITYNNGVSGVGATLTTTGSIGNIDGVPVNTVGTRVLVKDEPTLAYNGIYTYANSTTLVRAVDYDTAAEIQAGDLVFVNSGDTYENSQWVQIDTVTTIGTDPILWEQFGGAGTYSAGNGIAINGTVILARVDEVSTSFDAGGNIVVKQGAVLVDPVLGNAIANSLAVAGNGLITATNIELTGNVLAGNVNSNAAVTGVTGTFSGNVGANNAVITNDVAAATGTFSGNVDGANLNATTNVTGTTFTASGNVNANNAVITNDVSTTTVTASGNVNGANVNATTNVTGTTLTASGNVNANNAVITNDVAAATGTFSGNVNGGNIISSALVQGITLTASGNLNGNNAVITNDVSTATLTASGNVLADNVNANSAVTGITGSFSGNIDANNAIITNLVQGTTVTATGNVNGGNVVATNNVDATTITASGNVNANNAVITNNVGASTVTATGNIDGANINATTNVTATTVSGTTLTASGNVNANNAVITNDVSATTVTLTGNIDAAGGVFTGNVTAQYFIGNVLGNISGNIDAGGANTQIQFNDDDVLAGSAAFTFDKTSNLVTASGNVQAGNLIATTNVEGVTLTASGNVNANNAVVTNDVGAATGTFSTSVAGGNIQLTGDEVTGTNGIVNINGAAADIDFAVNGSGVYNVFFVDAGTGTASFGNLSQTTGALVSFNSTDTVLLPVGNTAQRPSGVTGMFRYNTTEGAIEWYDGSDWQQATTDFTVIVDDSFQGDGSTTTFTLSQNSTTAGTIVTINGVVQIPTTAYSVTGNSLQFTEAPEVSDTIDARILTTTATVSGISGSGGALFEAGTGTDFLVTGDLIPTANATYDLGNTSNWWKDGYFSGTTLFLGGLQLKAAANTFSVFQSDGTTPAAIAGTVETNEIISGTSSVSVISSGGNIRANVAGSTIQVLSSGGANVTGYLTATGNVTGGNISGTTGTFTNVGGTLTTAAQPNITSVGTLTGLTVSGSTTLGGITMSANTISSSGTTMTLDPSAPGATGLVVIAGNLQVNGTTTTIDSTTVTINDLVMSVANNAATSSAANGGGIEVGPAGSAYATWTYDQPNSRWSTALGIVATGNITGGNLITSNAISAASLSVGTGTVTLGNIVNANANGVGNIGSSTTYFNTVFAKATSAQYADLAEMYEADQIIEPGTVVCFGGAKEVTVCTEDGCKRIAGVVSTNPSYIMNAGLQGDNVVAVALTGRVPVKVTGTIRKGDMIVATGDGRGRAEADPKIGQVIGKALADFEGTDGVIEVVVGRL